MMPMTKNKLGPFICISAVQKYIRRGMEKEAMEFAVEMIHSSKAYCTMLCNRLRVICHEDLDMMTQPHIFTFVDAACREACDRYKDGKLGEVRLMIGNCIRLMARAEKSREGCHFGASIGLREQFEGYVPEVPDFAYDVHTTQGKRKKRGLDHFLAEGALLIPKQKKKDPYEKEAIRLWRQKYDGKQADLLDE